VQFFQKPRLAIHKLGIKGQASEGRSRPNTAPCPATSDPGHNSAFIKNSGVTIIGTKNPAIVLNN
jgi:hypothetical protein